MSNRVVYELHGPVKSGEVPGAFEYICGVSKIERYKQVCTCENTQDKGTPHYVVVYNYDTGPGGFKMSFPQDDVNNPQEVLDEAVEYGLAEECKKCMLANYKRKERGA